jgi:arylsulfatase
MWPVHYDGSPASEENLEPGHWKLEAPQLPIIDGIQKVDEVTSLEEQNEISRRYTERAVDFIDRHSDQPFFLYLAHTMPHVPLGASSRFRGSSTQGLYGDVMMELDWSVGEILASLEKHGIGDRTLVIYTTDNGPWLNYGNHAGSAGGLREGKGTSFEGGQRVPCVMYWPGQIEAGRICNRIASTIDILPTIVELTGAPSPEKKIDGVSLLPLLKNQAGADPRREFYYYYGRNLEAVRKDNWKLVFPHPHRTYEGLVPGHDGWPGPTGTATAEYALYNLRRDPGERYDIKEQNPQIVSELELIAEEARRQLGDGLKDLAGEEIRPAGSTEM